MCENLTIKVTHLKMDYDLLEDQIREVQKIMVDITRKPSEDKETQANRIARISRMFKNLLEQKEKLFHSTPETYKAIQCEKEEYARKYVKHHVLR